MIRSQTGGLASPEEKWEERLFETDAIAAREDQIQFLNMVSGPFPPKELEFRSLTFAGNRDDFDLFKSEILKLFYRFEIYSDARDKNEIYRLSEKFFPLHFSKE